MEVKNFSLSEIIKEVEKISGFTGADVEKAYNIGKKLNRKYIAVIIGEAGNEVIFNYSNKRRFNNICALYAGEIKDGKIFSIR